MARNTTLILSVTLTAFVLVVIGALAGQFTLAPEATAAAPTLPATPSLSEVVFDPPTPIPTATVAPSEPPYTVTPQIAAMLAHAMYPGASLQSEPQLVSYNGSVAYEVVTDLGAIYIDANSGQVLYNGVALPQANVEEQDEND